MADSLICCCFFFLFLPVYTLENMQKNKKDALREQNKELQTKLKEKEAFFKAIINNIPHPIFYKDTEGKYIGCNEAFSDFVGLPVEEIIGTTVHRVAPAEYADAYHQADLALIKQQGKQVSEAQLLHADKTYHDVIFNKSFFSSQDEKQTGLVGIIIDVTERKEFESKIKSQNEEFQQLNQKYTERNTELKSLNKELIVAKEKAIENDRLKSVFLANMSHEIRTPLNGILGFSELLRDSDITNENKIKYIDIIKNRGNLLLKIINDIIDISKLDSGETKLKEINASLNDIMNDIYKYYYAKKNEEGKTDINFRVFKEFNDGNDNVNIDPIKLQQVLTNLIENAFKFTNNGLVDFGYEVKDNKLKFFVKDTGKGIPNENMNMIFERFRQEDETPTRKYGGAGLGLTIAKAYVELMNGKIRVESEPKKGTTFYFSLPYQKIDNAPAEQKTVIETQTYDWSEKSILIVEDDYASYEYLRNVLSKTKVEFYWVDSGKKAIEMFLVKSNIDLVLMDIQLPDIDGYYATKEIKSIYPDVHIIAQTAHAFPEDKNKCLQAGCDEFITKPINKKKLLALIDGFFDSL
jgi:PAS domain S-box-containing protein